MCDYITIVTSIVNVILTGALVAITIAIHRFTKWYNNEEASRREQELNALEKETEMRKKELELLVSKRAPLIQILELQTPASFSFAHSELFDDADSNKIRKVINNLQKNFKEKFSLDVDVETLENIEEIRGFQKMNNSLYFRPRLFPNNKTTGGSIVLNLLEDVTAKHICVSSHLTEIKLKNYGAPINDLVITKAKLYYNDSNHNKDGGYEHKVKELNPADGTSIPLFIDTDEEGTVMVSEITNCFKYSLCNLEEVDPFQDAHTIEYKNSFFYYDKVEFWFEAESVFRVREYFKATAELVGKRFSWKTIIDEENPKRKEQL